MPGTFTLEIVTPERQVYSGEVTALQAPGLDGLFGVLHNRAPLVSALGQGPVTFVEADSGATRRLAVRGGFFEVHRNHAVLLAEQAEFAADIDAAQAQQQENEARQAMRGVITSDEEFEQRRAEAEWAGVRRRVAGERR